MSADRFSLSTPIYYVNGAPHIGHAYTTVAADTIARYWRSRGRDVFFSAGTDEHGAKNAEAATKVGKTPQAYVDEASALFSSAWDRLNVTSDVFWRTSSSTHVARVQEAFRRLHAVGVLYEGTYEGLYCTGCEAFLTEKDLDAEGKCPDHLRVPEKLSEKNWFFKLSAFFPRVKALIESGELRIQPDHIRNEVLGLFAQDLPDFSVSRQRVTWGVRLPFDDTQVAYVWVDALFNYVTALGYGDTDPAASREAFERFWPMDLHVIGKDIIKFHCIFWPALLLALDLPLPRAVFAHGYFTVDGRKMSKTIGNVIDPNTLVDQYGSDGARYLLLSQFPFGSDGDVHASRFDEQYNAALANDLGNLVHRITSMVQKYFDGTLSTEGVLEDALVLLSTVKETDVRIEEAFTRIAPDVALREVFGLVERANGLIEARKPWELAKAGEGDDLRALFTDLLGCLHALSVFLYPFFPDASVEIARRIGFSRSESSAPAIYRVTVGEPLFPRIEAKKAV